MKKYIRLCHIFWSIFFCKPKTALKIHMWSQLIKGKKNSNNLAFHHQVEIQGKGTGAQAVCVCAPAWCRQALCGRRQALKEQASPEGTLHQFSNLPKADLSFLIAWLNSLEILLWICCFLSSITNFPFGGVSKALVTFNLIFKSCWEVHHLHTFPSKMNSSWQAVSPVFSSLQVCKDWSCLFLSTPFSQPWGFSRRKGIPEMWPLRKQSLWIPLVTYFRESVTELLSW